MVAVGSYPTQLMMETRAWRLEGSFYSGGWWALTRTGNGSFITSCLCPRFLPSPVDTTQELTRDQVSSCPSWNQGLQALVSLSTTLREIGGAAPSGARHSLK